MSGAPTLTPPNPAFEQIIKQAQDDLARRLSISPDQVQLVEAQTVTWPDKGLGCPKPGMFYAQVQVDGMLIRFRAGGRTYEYHSGEGQPAFLCEQPPSP